jgi:hypothetical protein
MMLRHIEVMAPFRWQTTALHTTILTGTAKLIFRVQFFHLIQQENGVYIMRQTFENQHTIQYEGNKREIRLKNLNIFHTNFISSNRSRIR